MSSKFKIPFGKVHIGAYGLDLLEEAAESGNVTEGELVEKFEKQFAVKFGWKYAIATSSGTDAGIVVWSAIRELIGRPYFESPYVVTPACAFVATANCLLAAGLEPHFQDIDLDTLNLRPDLTLEGCMGLQFVGQMGSLNPLDKIAELVFMKQPGGMYFVVDACEAHGAVHPYSINNVDAAIYSLYPAHLVVGVEGGVICTNDEHIANLCRSIKSHGRPPGKTEFDFQRVGYNSKWSDLHAAVALDSLDRFDVTFKKRREVRAALIDELSRFEDDLILYRDAPGETIAPHAFPIMLRDEPSIALLFEQMVNAGIECKSLFGSLPTQHGAYKFLGHKLGDFPVAERVGRTGLHFSCADYLTDGDVKFIGATIESYLTSIAK